MIMIDTHIAVQLFEGKTAGLSAKALRALDHEPVYLSPAVMLELELLFEIKRIRLRAAPIVLHLRDPLNIHVARESFAEVAERALDFGFTRDPFDRLIVAHAAILRAKLITFDSQILAQISGSFS